MLPAGGQELSLGEKVAEASAESRSGLQRRSTKPGSAAQTRVRTEARHQGRRALRAVGWLVGLYNTS